MDPRMSMHDLMPDFYAAVLGMERAIHASSLEKGLLHLVKLRASQLNHCAYCVNMHTEECLSVGIDPRKLYLLTVWQESWLYSDRERAAMAWTESVTLVADTAIPQEDYDAVRLHFSELEVAELTAVICTINVWNRISVSSASPHE